jgi:hypothetical protein
MRSIRWRMFEFLVALTRLGPVIAAVMIHDSVCTCLIVESA